MNKFVRKELRVYADYEYLIAVWISQRLGVVPIESMPVRVAYHGSKSHNQLY